MGAVGRGTSPHTDFEGFFVFFSFVDYFSYVFLAA